MREFKKEVENSVKQGIPENAADDMLIEIEATERESQKDTPKLEWIVKRLKNVKELLTTATGVATATGTTITAAKALMPYVEKAIQLAGNLF